MIKCIKEDNTHQTYFTRPPVNLLTLFFEDYQIEKDYRKKAWQSRSERRLSHGQAGLIMEGAGSPHHGVHTRTWSPSGFTAVFDLVVSMLTFVIICLAAFVHYPATPWSITIIVVAALYHLACFYVFARQLVWPSSRKPQNNRLSLRPMQKPLLNRVYN